MMNQLQKNRLIILLLFAMSIIPFLFAYALKENPDWLTKRNNHGQLIIPPVATERQDFTGLDPFSSEHLNELKGHWLIINVVLAPQCNPVCQDAIHKSRQLQLMLSKDLTRTRRVVFILGDFKDDAASRWWREDKSLLKIRPNASLINKIVSLRAGRMADGLLFLMDPLGNLMMQYEPGFDSYKVKSDLTHLLKISQIG